MQNIHSTSLLRILTLLVSMLILKIVFGVLLTCFDYLPPNFESDFLRGRDLYFFGSYRWAFYAHITSGPASLILGMILLSEQFRRRCPKWHRFLGRFQTANVLLLVTPSGLWMSRYAETGATAGTGFAALAVATGVCVAIGWRSAVQRQFVAHHRWMCRCFVLLCSAVVLRIIGGLTTVAGIEAPWVYPLAAWTSWLVPLMAFEVGCILWASGAASAHSSIAISSHSGKWNRKGPAA